TERRFINSIYISRWKCDLDFAMRLMSDENILQESTGYLQVAVHSSETILLALFAHLIRSILPTDRCCHRSAPLACPSGPSVTTKDCRSVFLWDKQCAVPGQWCRHPCRTTVWEYRRGRVGCRRPCHFHKRPCNCPEANLRLREPLKAGQRN